MAYRAEEHPEEGLQVVSPSYAAAPDHNAEKIALPQRTGTSNLEAVKPDGYYNDQKKGESAPFIPTPNEKHTGGYGAPPPSSGQGMSSEPRRMCGMKRRTFFIVAAIAAIVVIGAVVGGAVGATVNKGSSSSNSNDGIAQTTGSTPSHTSTSPGTNSVGVQTTAPASSTTNNGITTTTISSSPTQTFVSDCPSSNNTIYSIKQDGNTLNYHKVCAADIGNDPNKHISIHQTTSSLDECIKLCANPPLNAQGNGRDPCSGVCWRNAEFHNVGVGFCFGFVVQGATLQNDYMANFQAPYCDSAVFIGNGSVTDS
ncbi:MAG: hypothetical protein MMC23_002079 [Stictis urceolatum]|nr:hypothetical protein [Stictis urceolata]